MKVFTMVLIVIFVFVISVFGFIADGVETGKYVLVVGWLDKLVESNSQFKPTITSKEETAFVNVNWNDVCTRLRYAIEKAGKSDCYLCVEFQNMVYVYAAKNGKVLRFNPELSPFFFNTYDDQILAAIKKIINK